METDKLLYSLNPLPTPALTDIFYAINADGTKEGQRTVQEILDLFKPTEKSGLTATGTNQSTALELEYDDCRIDTVAAGTGVKEKTAATKGRRRRVQSNGANAVKYYPYGNEQFYRIGVGLLGAGVPIEIDPGNQVAVLCYDDGILTLV